jgi:hypothetical protein
MTFGNKRILRTWLEEHSALVVPLSGKAQLLFKRCNPCPNCGNACLDMPWANSVLDEFKPICVLLWEGHQHANAAYKDQFPIYQHAWLLSPVQCPLCKSLDDVIAVVISNRKMISPVLKVMDVTATLAASPIKNAALRDIIATLTSFAETLSYKLVKSDLILVLAIQDILTNASNLLTISEKYLNRAPMIATTACLVTLLASCASKLHDLAASSQAKDLAKKADVVLAKVIDLIAMVFSESDSADILQVDGFFRDE